MSKLTIESVVRVVYDNDGQYGFRPDEKIPAGDFKVVVALVREAAGRGLVEIKEHRNSSVRERPIDLVMATLTDAGRNFIENCE